MSFGVKINVILGLGLAVVALVEVFAYRSIDVLVSTERLEGKVLADLGHLESVIGSVLRAEAAQRKFLITADPEDRAAYRGARDEASQELGQLRNEVIDPNQRRRLRELDALAADFLSDLDRDIERRARGPGAGAALLTLDQEVSRLSARIRRLAEEIKQQEIRSLRTHRSDTEFSAGVSSFLIFWGTALGGTLLVWAMVVIRRHQLLGRAAEEALKAGEAQLRLITDAVPALIAYVDRGGRLIFNNRAFERWFGRPAEEFHGRALPELLGASNWRTVEPRITEALAGREVNFDFAFLRKGRRAIDVAVHLVPRRSPGGEVVGYYSLATDISALKEVDRLKNEFVSTVSHELRTPLTSIRGSLGLVASGVTGALPEKARQLVQIATENCDRLVRLVNDILDTEKMLSGRMVMSLQEVDLADLVARSIRENEAFAGTLGVRVVLNASAAGARVQADPDRVVQVVTNLLSNASKFSPNGAVIEVRLERLGTTARVSVSDRGPGVPLEFRMHLFEPFTQLEASHVRKAGGTGLGLSICKGIVERLGGTIGFAPREGGGSTFHFELPLAGGAPA
ncbi:MAG TPA: ATP-binding protein [Burkholderiales bacterium]|nr:ATP-binding protein [Burkholderiales bacterium]